MSYFSEPYTHGRNIIKVELDFSNHETKFDLKEAADIDTSKFAKDVDLANSKSDTDNLDKLN